MNIETGIKKEKNTSNAEKKSKLAEQRVIIGNRLRGLREDKKMSQKDVAEVLGLATQGAYGKLESGDVALQPQHCVALADLFGVSCDYILRGIEAENVDVCKRTALDHKTLEVLIQNKTNAQYAFTESEDAEIIDNAKSALKQAESDTEKETALLNFELTAYEMLNEMLDASEYRIANAFLNQFIQDSNTWKELRSSVTQYVSCLESICEENRKHNGLPSREEALSQMGLSASKYIAGQAFANFFTTVFKSATFCKSVSRLTDEDIKLLCELGFVDVERKGG